MLLQVYGGLLLPVVLALLVGANILVWKQHRINYVFIFGKLARGRVLLIFQHQPCPCKFIIEVDVRTTIDPLQYVEIPSILFLTLSYCALLSFSSFGNVPATAWPLGKPFCIFIRLTLKACRLLACDSLARIHDLFFIQSIACVC